MKNFSHAFSIALAILLLPTMVLSESALEGIYEGQGAEGGTLRPIVDGWDVGVAIKAGCLGGVEGYFAENPKGDLFLLSSGYKEDGCAIAIHPQGKFALSLKQGPECSYHHGASCSFTGYVKRTR